MRELPIGEVALPFGPLLYPLTRTKPKVLSHLGDDQEREGK
jgi:hypothetical protein